jgi:CRP-like cAMP-binding protein
LKRITVKKGQTLQRAGDLNTKFFQVESGLLRSYFIDKKGKEHIYPNDEPCDLFIDCLEDSIIIQIEKNFDTLSTEPLKLAKRLKVLQKRVVMLMSSVALERYEYFITTYPSIIQRVPQRMIASYLGITPEALSRVRKEISLRK